MTTPRYASTGCPAESQERGDALSSPCPWARESAVFVVSSNNGNVNNNNRNNNALVRAVRAVPGQ